MSTKFIRLIFVLVLLFGLLAWQVPQPARAAGPWYVAPMGSDIDDCLSPGTACATINAAIGKASSGDSVYVAEGMYKSEYTEPGYEVVLIDKDITLSGGWDETFTTQTGRSTIDGQGSARGITVNGDVTATIEKLIVQNGFDGLQGGGILNYGSLTINDGIITANKTSWGYKTGEGAGIWSGWDYMSVSDPSLTLNHTLVFGNENNNGSGGGIFNSPAYVNYPEYSYHVGNVTLNYSVVRDNVASAGGGIYNVTSGEFALTLNQSTVSGNWAYVGGGIYFDGKLVLNNSTVSNNEAEGNGGGLYNDPDNINDQLEGFLYNSTVSANTAGGSGGGLYNPVGNISLQNSLIASNTAEETGPDCSGGLESAGYNLIGDITDCAFTPITGDLTGIDAQIGLLIGPSGGQKYHPLLAGSPAIDAGNPTGCTDQDGNLLTTDQRGVARVGACDIGAYEYTTPGPAFSISVTGGDNQHTITSTAFPELLQTAALDSQGSPVEGVNVEFTAPGDGPSGIFADTGTNVAFAVTGQDGVATAPMFTANDQVGAYTVTASATGLGTVQFNLEQIAILPNDNFANAVVIGSLPFSATVDMREATSEPDEPRCFIFTERTVWYTFTPSTRTIARASIFDGAWANVTIYRKSGPGITNLQIMECVGASDPITFLMEAGQTYYMQVGTPFGEAGTVQFSLAEGIAITGRVTDAATGAPLPEYAAHVTLYKVCGVDCLEYVRSRSIDNDSLFLFESSPETPIPVGTYWIEVTADAYQTGQFGPFEFSGVNLDVGDLPIVRLPLIGSIRGRLVDAATGAPVSQQFWPSVDLYRCNDAGCTEFVMHIEVDSQGRFRFEGSEWNLLPVGTYQVRAFAAQYEQSQTAPFTVGEGIHKTVGTLRLTSFPVRFSDIQACPEIPATGGECAFSVNIWNGLSSRLEGRTWNLVNSTLSDWFPGLTEFQLNDPQKLVLDRGENRIFHFSFHVPATDNSSVSWVCTKIFVGQGGSSLFNTIGFRDLFCFYKDASGFSLVSTQEASDHPKSEATAETVMSEVEPNNTCQSAQNVESVALPFMLDGNLDSALNPDIDFFRFKGAPGTMVRIDLYTMLDIPLLGFFDSNCNLVSYNDETLGTYLPLDITIPPDGIFILAATAYPDFDFAGGGNGPYQLTVTPIQKIGSIRGRVIDAGTGIPLRGDVDPFAFVVLNRCEGFGCSYYMGSQPTDRGGRFLFDGAALLKGNYQLTVWADQYHSSQSDVFAVGENENYNAGRIALTPFPVRFSEVHACAIPPQGGSCEFSATITNRLPTRLSGQAWSIVDGFDIGSYTDFTIFQPGSPLRVNLGPGKSNTLRFRFHVPGSVADGATICAKGFVGQDPGALFNTVGHSTLFCISKGSSGFTLMSGQEMQAALQQIQSREAGVPVLAPDKKK